jgi:hypothetical protein
VRVVNQDGTTQSLGSVGLSNSIFGGVGTGIGTSIWNWLGSLGGGAAEQATATSARMIDWAPIAGSFDSGGDMLPGHAYLVGEKSAEIVHGPGRVTSSSDTAKAMRGHGGDTYLSIDARGVDPLLVEQRTRIAIQESNKQAVASSIKLSREMDIRRPF